MNLWFHFFMYLNFCFSFVSSFWVIKRGFTKITKTWWRTYSCGHVTPKTRFTLSKGMTSMICSSTHKDTLAVRRHRHPWMSTGRRASSKNSTPMAMAYRKWKVLFTSKRKGRKRGRSSHSSSEPLASITSPKGKHMQTLPRTWSASEPLITTPK